MALFSIPFCAPIEAVCTKGCPGLDKGIAEVKAEAVASVSVETPRKFAQRLHKHGVTPAQVAQVTGIPLEEIGELRSVE